MDLYDLWFAEEEAKKRAPSMDLSFIYSIAEDDLQSWKPIMATTKLAPKIFHEYPELKKKTKKRGGKQSRAIRNEVLEGMIARYDPVDLD